MMNGRNNQIKGRKKHGKESSLKRVTLKPCIIVQSQTGPVFVFPSRGLLMLNPELSLDAEGFVSIGSGCGWRIKILPRSYLACLRLPQGEGSLMSSQDRTKGLYIDTVRLHKVRNSMSSGIPYYK